ncbi:L-gulonate 5-dehydrogenase [Haloactinomyces albus]|uniref:L-gulonate 5-dehydrogenase n=1 Tax=Haloactinomyces albus TaxID=1352928 RepID=A0AAE3ZC56_9ACTN|nr:alcohol dehydrogenase catalytic domain-containing protein [Haloactinomyces albus]MDR7300419.1 L-gulonate 5-dehydrogenase [Haloactinomyces albus]
MARTVAKETIEYHDVPMPVAGPGEALVRIESLTLCGTDLHIWEDDYATDLPIVQGHEFVGIVEQASGSQQAVAVGDRVAVSPMTYCGRCYACSIGRVNACVRMSVYGCYEDGALAEYMAVPVTKLHRIPDGLDPRVAPLAEPASIAMQAVDRGRPRAAEKAFVFGCGPIGLLSTMYLTSLGVEVVAADTREHRCEFAGKFGAVDTMVIDPAVSFPDAAQHELLSHWTGAQGPSLVVEATGAPDSLTNALSVVATAGRVAAVGISDREVSLSMRTLPVKDIDLLGSRNSQDLIGESLALLSEHTAEADMLITHRFPFDRLGEAFEVMRSRTEPVGKVAIDMPGAFT